MFEDLDLLDADLLLQPGLSIFGAYDLGQRTQQMNALRQVTVAIARALLKGGLVVIEASLQGGQGGLLSRELPGQTTRQNVRGHLLWHKDRLASLSDPTAPYDAAQDLKKWVLQAYIESNAVDEGRAVQERAWQDMWNEIGEELARLPARTLEAAAQAVSTVMSTAINAAGRGIAQGLGLPTWLFWAGGAALVLGTGVGVFKILLVTAPAVVPAVVKRYLP